MGELQGEVGACGSIGGEVVMRVGEFMEYLMVKEKKRSDELCKREHKFGCEL